MMPLKDIHETLYACFREHYESLSEDCQLEFDKLLFQYLREIHFLHLTDETDELLRDGKVQMLVWRFKRDLKQRICVYLHEFQQVYQRRMNQTLGITTPTSISGWIWDSIFASTDEFCEKFCREFLAVAKDALSAEEFNDLFPPEAGKGRYHARLKTLCYMILLQFANAIGVNTADARAVEPMILTENGQMTAQGGLFKIPVTAEDSKRFIWDFDGEYVSGTFAPSHFGSHEITIPNISHK